MTVVWKALLGLLAMTLPAAGPSELLYPKPDLTSGPRNLPLVALTFDAERGIDGLEDLLNTLEREDVAATFFLTGRWADEYPGWAREIAKQGHTIGNHSWGHKDLVNLADWEVQLEILRVDDRFSMTFGSAYRPIFRVPFGRCNYKVRAIVDELGYQIVGWSINTLDDEPGSTSEAITERVLHLQDGELRGAIVLFNVGCPETAKALPDIIHRLRGRGFDFVPVYTWTNQKTILGQVRQ